MADEMTSIPPRVNEVEREVHTLRHRISVIEETHKDTPHRLTKLEQVAEDMPRIRQELREQGEMIRKGFTLTNGMLYGAGAMWFVFQAGPQLLKFLGSN